MLCSRCGKIGMTHLETLKTFVLETSNNAIKNCLPSLLPVHPSIHLFVVYHSGRRFYNGQKKNFFSRVISNERGEDVEEMYGRIEGREQSARRMERSERSEWCGGQPYRLIGPDHNDRHCRPIDRCIHHLLCVCVCVTPWPFGLKCHRRIECVCLFGGCLVWWADGWRCGDGGSVLTDGKFTNSYFKRMERKVGGNNWRVLLCWVWCLGDLIAFCCVCVCDNDTDGRTDG